MLTVSRNFNPLCLAEGEQYVQDHACRMNGTPGRLRIGSKSLVFDPDDVVQKLIRVQFRHVTATEWGSTTSSVAGGPRGAGGLGPNGSSSAAANLFSIQASSVQLISTQQIHNETRIVTPVQHIKSPQSFTLELHYGNIKRLEELIKKFLTIAGVASAPPGSRGRGSSSAANTLPALAGGNAAMDAERAAQRVIAELYRDVSFDLSRLDHRERGTPLLPKEGVWCDYVKPMLKHRGRLMITRKAVHFQPVPNFLQKPQVSVELDGIVHVLRRIVRLSDCGLEVVVRRGKGDSVFLAFESAVVRNEVLRVLETARRAVTGEGALGLGGAEGLGLLAQGNDLGEADSPTAGGGSGGQLVQGPSATTGGGDSHFMSSLLMGGLGVNNQTENLSGGLSLVATEQGKSRARMSPVPRHEIRRMRGLWQSGKISNYHYLDFLNCAAGRSVNDFSQYPIFPWVLSNYESSELDLSDPANYRDLSKPLGALNTGRLKQYQNRMTEMPEGEKFLYGTHYSTPAYVLYFLLRQMPECMLRLHGGNFDAWNRLFHSIETTHRYAVTK